MLTLQDCIAFAGISAEQLEAIYDREQLAGIFAAIWASHELDTPGGRARLLALVHQEITGK